MTTRFSKSKKRIAIIAVFCMIFTLLPSNVFAFEASDISGHWAKDKVQAWIDNSLIKGYEDGTFRPDNNISRAEFMALVNGAYGYTDSATTEYADVKAGAWYANEIAKAKAAGYISGYPDNTIRPDNPISRAEAASIIMKISKLEGATVITSDFSDASSLGWSKGAVNAVSASNIMSGYPDGSFKPQQSIKRSEAVVALDKAIAYSKENITYEKVGTYGPESGIQEIEGNVTVTEKGTILQNMTINGSLTISKNVGDGNITLDNVIVKGETMIYGGGQNSIIVINSTLGKVTVSKVDGKIRIVISGSTTVREVFANSGVKLEESNLTGNSAGFQEITIDASEDDTIVLIGSFSQVNVEAEGLEVNIPKGTTVDSLVLDEKAKITGTGTITKADINVSGVTFETAPKTTDVATGVTKPEVGNSSSTSSGGSGSGGGGGSSSSVAVSAITVTGTGNATTITTDNGTLQMLAAVLPANATNKTVTWSVTNGTGSATISATGLLTAVTNGTVTVKVTSVSTGTVYGTAAITISNQLTAATFTATGEPGTHNGITYQGYALTVTADGTSIPLNTADITGMTVMNPGETVATTLTVTVDSDPLLWFNVAKASGDYVYTITTANGTVYTATINNTQVKTQEQIAAEAAPLGLTTENMDTQIEDIDIDIEDSHIIVNVPYGFDFSEIVQTPNPAWGGDANKRYVGILVEAPVNGLLDDIFRIGGSFSDVADGHGSESTKGFVKLYLPVAERTAVDAAFIATATAITPRTYQFVYANGVDVSKTFTYEVRIVKTQEQIAAEAAPLGLTTENMDTQIEDIDIDIEGSHITVNVPYGFNFNEIVQTPNPAWGGDANKRYVGILVEAPVNGLLDDIFRIGGSFSDVADGHGSEITKGFVKLYLPVAERTVESADFIATATAIIPRTYQFVYSNGVDVSKTFTYEVRIVVAP